nr:MAG TPA: hypothetical protein [Caudoviricetes sp.]
MIVVGWWLLWLGRVILRGGVGCRLIGRLGGVRCWLVMVVVVSGRLMRCRCVVPRLRMWIMLFLMMMIRLVICGRCVVSIMR